MNKPLGARWHNWVGAVHYIVRKHSPQCLVDEYTVLRKHSLQCWVDVNQNRIRIRNFLHDERVLLEKGGEDGWDSLS